MFPHRQPEQLTLLSPWDVVRRGALATPSYSTTGLIQLVLSALSDPSKINRQELKEAERECSTLCPLSSLACRVGNREQSQLVNP